MAPTESLEVIEVPRSHQLVVSRPAEEVLAEAQKAAAALTTVLKGKAHPVIINDQQYLEYEDWQTCGRFYNVTAKVVDTKYVEYGTARGFEARAVALRGDGMEISAAESLCLDDEERWTDRDLFQIKSMAQTRACAKALRNVLAWVVVLGGYGTTPAEEMDGVRRQQQAQPSADGLVTIKSVKPKDGGGKDGKKPWTRFDVTLSDGRKASTFDKGLGAQAEALQKSGLRLKLVDGEHIEKSEDGKYLNLLKLPDGAVPEKTEPLTREAAAAQPLPAIEPPIAETVMTIREIKDNKGVNWLVVQGSEREYYASEENEQAKAITSTIRDCKAAKSPLVFKYEWKPSPKGPRRVCTGLADVDTLKKDPPAAQPAAGDPPKSEELTWS